MEDTNDIRFKEKLFFAKLITITGAIICLIVGGCTALFMTDSAGWVREFFVVFSLTPFFLGGLVFLSGLHKWTNLVNHRKEAIENALTKTGSLIVSISGYSIIIGMFLYLIFIFNIFDRGLSLGLKRLVITLPFYSPVLLLGLAFIFTAKYHRK